MIDLFIRLGLMEKMVMSNLSCYELQEWKKVHPGRKVRSCRDVVCIGINLIYHQQAVVHQAADI